ncbi:hypothetical protein D6C83_09373 [Aureobasidium pullulans]|uniref:Uncharacterized protein n=1 Tax=Aureobasidium pullulans TaxID=5580 RepID=A0A4V4L300_AURPU|nr:hypothetical protein D6C83_09373 [Aureobasidium pullulans]
MPHQCHSDLSLSFRPGRCSTATLLFSHQHTSERYQPRTHHTNNHSRAQRLATALAARRIAIPDPDNNIRKVYRHALEIADTERRFPFMKLPKDVRMVVYDYALTYETVQTSRPPLLSVCHQIREEGSPTFFRINEFNIRWERSSG